MEELSIGFPYCRKLTNKGLNPFGAILNQHKRLKSFSLNFEGCSKLTCGTFGGINEIILKKPNLESLKLNFSKTQVEDEGLNLMLGSLINLREFEMNVERCPDIKNIALSKNIKKMPKLERFVVNTLHCPEISAKALKDLGKDVEMKASKLIEFTLSR